MLPDQGHKQVGKSRHRNNGHTHDQGDTQVNSNRERGTNPQDLQSDRVIAEDGLQQKLFGFHDLSLLSPTGQIAFKALFAKPELNHVVCTSRGISGASQTIYPLLIPVLVPSYAAYNNSQRHITLVVINLLAFPAGLPAWVVDFTAQAWRFAMLIEA